MSRNGAPTALHTEERVKQPVTICHLSGRLHTRPRFPFRGSPSGSRSMLLLALCLERGQPYSCASSGAL